MQRRERRERVQISAGRDAEREWAAALMAESEPWVTLKLTFESCLRACEDPEHRLFVARQGGHPRGMILLHRQGVAGSPYIKSIAVDPEFRASGIGAELVRFAEDLFRGRARHMFLCVSSFNAKARAFWERLGYRPVGELEDYVVDGFSEILMHKRL